MSRAKWAKKWHPYKSGLEAAMAAFLEEKGIEFRYEPEAIEYRKRVVKGVCDDCGGNKTSQRRNYTPDFRLTRRPNSEGAGGFIYLETKGNFTPSDRAKMVAVKQGNPKLDIRLVFGSNNKLKKNKNERYSDWCDRHGFLWCIGVEGIPNWWLQPATRVQEHRDPGPVLQEGRKGTKKGRRS